MTCEKDIVVVRRNIDSIDPPYHFGFLDVRPSESSSGKCWILHMDLIRKLTVFLFPSGLRLYGENNEVKEHGYFFLEYQDFDRSRLELLATLIHIKPRVGINDCHLIVADRLFHNDEGRLSIGYH